MNTCDKHMQKHDRDEIKGDTRDCDYCKLLEVARELREACKAHTKFWDDMPKGQLGKLSCNVGLLNDAFVSSRDALYKAKEAGL